MPPYPAASLVTAAYEPLSTSAFSLYFGQKTATSASRREEMYALEWEEKFTGFNSALEQFDG